MPRTLSWLQNGSKEAGPAPVKSSSVVKRRQVELPGDEGADHTRFEVPSRPSQKSHKSDRTPSSSPPPSFQPPPYSPLRPGLDADDAWVMVEDELLATAQQFTRHLHQAEYDRLKNLAKSRKEVDRPTDERTKMRPELRIMKEGDTKQRNIKAGMKRTFNNAGAGESGEDDMSDEESFLARDHNPWSGTQLQQYMTKTTGTNYRSLVGIQKVQSHTRAAAGFRANTTNSPRKHKSSSLVPSATNDTRETQIAQDDDYETDDLDVDLGSLRPRSKESLNLSPLRARHSARREMSRLKRTAAEKQQSSKKSLDELPMFTV